MHRAWLIGIALLFGPERLLADEPLEAIQSFAVEVPFAPIPVRSEGRQLLVYELHLTNFSDQSLTLMSVGVLDDRRTSLAIFAGEDLAGRLKIVGRTARTPSSAAIAPGERAVVFIEVTVPLAAKVRALAHAITYETADKTTHTLTPTPVSLRAMNVPRLGPPLHGGPWVAVHDPRWQRGHRRMFYAIDGTASLPGRFAIDWVGVDAQGAVTHGDADRPADAIGYGSDVLAGADATVASVRDGMAESGSIKDNPSHRLGDGAGNHVVLELAPGVYAFYEHLRAGSVRVHAGDRVRKGEVIGALGFSGDSTGPHLHLHVADCGDPLSCEGVPFVIETMQVLGRYDDLDGLGKKPWRAEERAVESEWPGSNVVVRFR